MQWRYDSAIDRPDVKVVTLDWSQIGQLVRALVAERVGEADTDVHPRSTHTDPLLAPADRETA